MTSRVVAAVLLAATPAAADSSGYLAPSIMVGALDGKDGVGAFGGARVAGGIRFHDRGSVTEVGVMVTGLYLSGPEPTWPDGAAMMLGVEQTTLWSVSAWRLGPHLAANLSYGFDSEGEPPTRGPFDVGWPLELGVRAETDDWRFGVDALVVVGAPPRLGVVGSVGYRGENTGLATAIVGALALTAVVGFGVRTAGDISN